MTLFIISFLIAIILHELGHLFIAKLCKCKVDVFSIGFWKPILFKTKIHGTIYQITPWILGGYNALKGELDFNRSKYSFTNKTYSQKLYISLAGCAINILLGIIFLFLCKLHFNYNFYIFGFINLVLGISNLLPIPCLDGSYPLLFLLEFKWGKKKCYSFMKKINSIFFIIINILNIICIIYLLGLWIWSIYIKYYSNI